MSTIDSYDDDDVDEPRGNSAIQDLRNKVKDQEAQLAELNGLKEKAAQADESATELALYKAGLGELSERQRKALLATTDDATPEALRKAAEELSFVQPPPPPSAPADVQAMDRMSSASTGGNPAGTGGDVLSEIKAAKNEEELMAVLSKHNLPIHPGSHEIVEGFGEMSVRT